VVLPFKTLLLCPGYDRTALRDLETVETVFRPSDDRAGGTTVNTECRVKGVENLRTVDGNVFLSRLGCNIRLRLRLCCHQLSLFLDLLKTKKRHLRMF
jgi:hypothetical protein